MISHILMTRFNVRSSSGESIAALSQSWLDERWTLFERYCLPSVVQQTSRPDVWLVLFDSATPSGFKEKIERWHKEFDFMIPAFVHGAFNQEAAIGLVNRHMGRHASWILTTRLDNDDAIHPEFCHALRQSVRAGTREFLNIRRGLIVSSGRFYRKSDYSNPFISLSESASNPATVWVDQHHRLSRHAPVRQIALRDGWIQIVHGGNLANQVRGVRASLSSLDRSKLPSALFVDMPRESFSDLILDNSLGLARRYYGSLLRYVRTRLRELG